MQKILGNNIFQTLKSKNVMYWALECLSDISKLTIDQKEKLCEYAELKAYQSGDIVTDKTSKSMIYVVVMGSIISVKYLSF